jgi:hypothetical protein
MTNDHGLSFKVIGRKYKVTDHGNNFTGSRLRIIGPRFSVIGRQPKINIMLFMSHSYTLHYVLLGLIHELFIIKNLCRLGYRENGKV